jgi:hypothetical protein
MWDIDVLQDWCFFDSDTDTDPDFNPNVDGGEYRKRPYITGEDLFRDRSATLIKYSKQMQAWRPSSHFINELFSAIKRMQTGKIIVEKVGRFRVTFDGLDPKDKSAGLWRIMYKCKAVNVDRYVRGFEIAGNRLTAVLPSFVQYQFMVTVDGRKVTTEPAYFNGWFDPHTGGFELKPRDTIDDGDSRLDTSQLTVTRTIMRSANKFSLFDPVYDNGGCWIEFSCSSILYPTKNSDHAGYSKGVVRFFFCPQHIKRAIDATDPENVKYVENLYGATIVTDSSVPLDTEAAKKSSLLPPLDGAFVWIRVNTWRLYGIHMMIDVSVIHLTGWRRGGFGQPGVDPSSPLLALRWERPTAEDTQPHPKGMIETACFRPNNISTGYVNWMTHEVIKNILPLLFEAMAEFDPDGPSTWKLVETVEVNEYRSDIGRDFGLRRLTTTRGRDSFDIRINSWMKDNVTFATDQGISPLALWKERGSLGRGDTQMAFEPQRGEQRNKTHVQRNDVARGDPVIRPCIVPAQRLLPFQRIYIVSLPRRSCFDAIRVDVALIIDKHHPPKNLPTRVSNFFFNPQTLWFREFY